MMSATLKFIDCYAPVDAPFADALTVANVAGVCRYLGRKSRGYAKGMTPAEVALLKAKQFYIVSNWEANPTSPAGVTAANGTADGRDSVIDANWLGQPPGSDIYYSIDFDIQPDSYPLLIPYFNAIHREVGNKYRIGAYIKGAARDYLRNNCTFVHDIWEPAAWGGRLTPDIAIFQSQYNVKIGGREVDIDIVQGNPGWWGGPNMQLTTCYVNGKEQPAIIYDNKIWPLWSGLATVPGFQKSRDNNGLWHFSTDTTQIAPKVTVKEVSVLLSDESTTTFTAN